MKQELILVEPSLDYRESFQHLVSDYLKNRENIYTDLYKPALSNFNRYVKKLLDHGRGMNLPYGEVSYSTFWLVDRYRKVYGNVRVRHQSLFIYGNIGYDIRPSYRGRGYGTLMLALTLEKARDMGIHRIKVACDQRNKASEGVIENNGGIFLEQVYDRKTRLFVNCYFIDIPDADEIRQGG